MCHTRLDSESESETSHSDENRSVATGAPLGGKKVISSFAGMALIINNVTGPGVPGIPNLFMEAGWLYPTLLFLVVWILSSFSTGMYAEAMRMVPGNEHFRGRIEYTTIVKHYFGNTWFKLSQIGLNGALQSLNIISVIQSAQVMDQAISSMFGKSCAINLSPFDLTFDGSGSNSGEWNLTESTKFWSCIDLNDLDRGNAWGCHLILTAGFVVSLCATLPMGMYNLDDNIKIQVGAFILTLACWVVWFVVAFWSSNFSNDEWQIKAVTDTSKSYRSQTAVLGAVLFNFGYVTTIPSWVNEKRPAVSVNKSVWSATFVCMLVFFGVGVTGCMAFHQFLEGPATGTCEKVPGMNTACASSILQVFTTPRLMEYYMKDVHDNAFVNFIVQMSVYMFAVGAVMSGIPVFSIVVRYNCLENGLPKWFSDFWGIWFPWLIAIPLLYQPDALNQFILFSSLIFVSFTDFIVPWYLYYHLMQLKQVSVDEGDIQDDEESTYLIADSDAGSLVGTHIPVHWAFPPSWGLSVVGKKRAALVLVIILTISCAIGTVTSIMTSASGGWDCAAVGA